MYSIRPNSSEQLGIVYNTSFCNHITGELVKRQVKLSSNKIIPFNISRILKIEEGEKFNVI